MIKRHQPGKYLASARLRVFILATFVATCLFSAVISFHITASAQGRRVRQPTVRVLAPSTIDYSRFSHATKKHQSACNTCHKVPTGNWKKVRDFPDVADFPDHAACVSCH
ncbi:MAG: hypothetical protein ACREA9_22440, partial [Pyrinomonadaceae bacterium]